MFGFIFTLQSKNVHHEQYIVTACGFKFTCLWQYRNLNEVDNWEWFGSECVNNFYIPIKAIQNKTRESHFFFNFKKKIFILFYQFANKGRWQHNRTLSPLQGVSPNPTHTMNINTNYTNPYPLVISMNVYIINKNINFS